ncbi:uncharacterized protein [Spinacia oleracea]|uniref:Non-specific serine/threonine protein kinase n=1 Tax=Spinacia oleracea TaxID=3562 RepID=A0A9R0J803_SPIOL|nr:uncharacterized protein LOC110801805 [Spinacia oleracea]
MAYVHILVLYLSCFLIIQFGSARVDITTTEFLRDSETLESSKAFFKFGFFSPINSTNRYVGIWYNKEVDDRLEVVWVANRENPLNDSSGVLKLSEDGNLQLFDGRNKRIWSSNVSVKNVVNSPVAQLLNTGKLVLLSNASGIIMWQSFDHPTDSLLPHMEVRITENTTVMPLLASWKSASDPAVARFTASIVQRSLLEIFIWDGDLPYWRSGPWDGRLFVGVRAMYYSAQAVGFRPENDNEGPRSLSFSMTSQRVTEHYVLAYDGMLSQKDWEDDRGDWTVIWQSIEHECDIYGKCGEFGSCNSKNSPICRCLRGFEPRNNQEWSAGNWSNGCVRGTPLQCGTRGGKTDGFLRLRNVKVPDNTTWMDSVDDGDCQRQCLGNCSCSAYAYTFGFGCMIWSGSLIDIQEFSSAGVDLFVRVAHSELAGKTSKWKVVVPGIVIGGTAVLVVSLYSLWRWLHRRYAGKKAANKESNWHNNMGGSKLSNAEFQDLPLLKFETLVLATNNFSVSKKLGQGGFGPVYKGKFEDGQEVAVKRLSRASGQGQQEFMNEVAVISKLQHRNLVRLLGCCVEGEEKLLVYEYMPNKSLDALLFDPSGREHLDWKKRFNIIKAISRGLLYLHRDSRLRIIHRDLKASNILLDGNLNPKISDFGMAKIFGGSQDQGDTKRIVGTYGYMSPEYAMEGRFSEKSDVYSFGVLLLEIVSGRRNSSFKDEESLSLLAHAWKLWNEGGILSLVDPAISALDFEAEILRCIQIGLLSVQEFPEDRPSITTVVTMIESEVTDLPCPTQPGFTQRRIAFMNGVQQNVRDCYSVNGASITSLGGRGKQSNFLYSLLLDIMDYYLHLLFIFLSWYGVSGFGSVRNTITTTQFLRDPDTLVSINTIFKFGFFSPINSTNRYVGIWYNKEVADAIEVVWVANRETPLTDSSGVVKISGIGNLQVLDGKNKSIWSSNVTTNYKANITSYVAKLLDAGNLVLHANDVIIWQSFDHLTDTLLHNTKLRLDDENHTPAFPRIASWKSSSDPSIGRFTAGLIHSRLPEIFVWDGDRPYWRSGPGYGNMFLGVKAMYYFAQEDGFDIENETGGTPILSFSSASRNVTEHYVLNYDGQLLKRDYSEANGSIGGYWFNLWWSVFSDCDIYGKCGEFGSCNSDHSPICSCLNGFQPRNNTEWNAGNWSRGCKRKTPLQKCGTVGGGEEDGFLRLRNTKVPENATWLYSEGEEDCRQTCLGNCACLAYAYYLGLGCLIWNETLIDIQEFTSVGVDLFIRVAHSELVVTKPQQQGKASKTKLILMIVMIGLATISVIMLIYCVWRRTNKRNGVTRVVRNKTLLQTSTPKDGTSKVEIGDLPVFGLEKLTIATDHFQDFNKLGRGGFGSVYKGKLEDGQEIAVKRLSKGSGQGLKEFMTEVLVISKLQHRNLVKLLGCCIEGEEKMLVYEYMPNKSLDALLFDSKYQKILDWKKRFNIILGICRGLLYLHRDSRLRIIHRDLKASNILLDGNFNPKISDFGMARIFGGNQDQGDTKRIVGTYGYMSPEYAMEGRFSEKSDVFSLGVLLLEIVSGRRNNLFKDEDSLSLLGYAWNSWNEGNILSLIDPTISESAFHGEILKCVQLGLLCVQEFPNDRPSVSMVISMIESEVTDLPSPSQPGFTQRRVGSPKLGQQNGDENCSVDRVSITVLMGR